MRLSVESVIGVLERTPSSLRGLLKDLPEELARGDEGEDSWSPFDIVGHLVQGERTDWIPRVRLILEHGESREFTPFDRFAHFEASRGKSLEDLLAEFESLRSENLAVLTAMDLQPSDFQRRGRHPDIGVVTLGQLLGAWTVHDLGHIAQIARVMAKQFGDKVGPWRAYLPVLDPRSAS